MLTGCPKELLPQLPALGKVRFCPSMKVQGSRRQGLGGCQRDRDHSAKSNLLQLRRGTRALVLLIGRYLRG